MLTYNWKDGSADREIRFASVPGTAGKPFLFGRPPATRSIELSDFFVMTTPVTQALWSHVMGSNPSVRPRAPVSSG
jgi:formylglycine-generating enzyme required for sulfatase activity